MMGRDGHRELKEGLGQLAEFIAVFPDPVLKKAARHVRHGFDVLRRQTDSLGNKDDLGGEMWRGLTFLYERVNELEAEILKPKPEPAAIYKAREYFKLASCFQSNHQYDRADEEWQRGMDALKEAIKAEYSGNEELKRLGRVIYSVWPRMRADENNYTAMFRVRDAITGLIKEIDRLERIEQNEKFL